jgi:hypothetical protein
MPWPDTPSGEEQGLYVAGQGGGANTPDTAAQDSGASQKNQ